MKYCILNLISSLGNGREKTANSEGAVKGGNWEQTISHHCKRLKISNTVLEIIIRFFLRLIIFSNFIFVIIPIVVFRPFFARFYSCTFNFVTSQKRRLKNRIVEPKRRTAGNLNTKSKATQFIDSPSGLATLAWGGLKKIKFHDDKKKRNVVKSGKKKRNKNNLEFYFY